MRAVNRAWDGNIKAGCLPSRRASPTSEALSLAGVLGQLALAPFLEHRLAAARIALFGHVQHDDAVGAEMPVVLAQLAPRHDHAHLLEEAEGERPDDALA